MIVRLLAFDAALVGFAIAALVVTLSVSCLVFVRKRWPNLATKDSNDIADPIYSMVGVLYAVLLAFMVIVVWEQFTTAQDQTELEASAVSDLLRVVDAFPVNERMTLKDDLIAYCRDVVEHEWPLMARGADVELESPAYRKLWTDYLAMTPEEGKQVSLYNDCITRLNDLGSKRKLRLVSSEAELPGIMWVLLIGGSCISIGFTFFFGTENVRLHAIIVGLLSALLGFVLFLIFSLEHPYSGNLSVKPAGFEKIIASAKR
jgi:hypothetical protein